MRYSLDTWLGGDTIVINANLITSRVDTVWVFLDVLIVMVSHTLIIKFQKKKEKKSSIVRYKKSFIYASKT